MPRQLVAFLLSLAALCCSTFALAQADLMIYPTRIVFEGNQRTAQIDLMNTGAEAATYRITFQQKRMTELGDFVAVDTPQPGELFADQLVRYSPRQVTLAPNTAQTVRLILRKPAELQTGEYRSHLVFERVSVPGGAGRPQPGSADSDIAIALTALIGVSVPVIVRHGETSVTVALDNIGVTGPQGELPAAVTLDMKRAGTRSVYGDLLAYFTPRGRPERLVAQANGVAVYTPNQLRRVRLPLRQDANWPLGPGQLRVIYRGRPEEGSRTLAEAGATLP